MNSKRLIEAFAYAARIHADQTRKGGDIPYLSHLMAVAALVAENGGDEDQVIAALLHDGPEDQGGEDTLADIRGRFGDRVGRIVAECSDTFKVPKPAWQPRKEIYLEHLPSAHDETLLVSLADKVHNLGSIIRDYRVQGEDLWERFHADRDEIEWYYKSLLEVFEHRKRPDLEPLLDQFRGLVHAMTALTEGTAPSS